MIVLPNPSETWSRWGIRKQLTAVAVLVVALPLGVSILVLANLLTHSLSNAQVSQALEVSQRTAGYVSERGPSQLPGSLQLDDGYRAQLIDASGRVVWTSNPHYDQPMTSMHPEPGTTQQEGAVRWWGPGDRNEHRDLVVAQGIHVQGQPCVTVVATSQEDQQSAVTVTAGLLFACVPLVMLAAGLVAWWVGGRALDPVDEMNEQVSRITSSTLDERVPLPVARDELRALATTMNAMLAGLEASQESQRRFISDASHELRSPLASLSGALEIATHDDDLQTWRELAPLMQAETTRMNGLVQGLLELSRGADASSRLALQETDLDDMAASEARRLRTTTEVEVQTAITATRVLADPAKIGQVLRNLCDNAARHASHVVRVSVEPWAEERDPVVPGAEPLTAESVPGGPGGARVVVEDDGNGIDPDDRERIFERFVRLQESRSRDEGGSGLGLAIVSQIVRAHGGTITAGESELGGARFELLLPGRHSIASR